MAFIFDLDGTLMNTIADMGNSMNRVLQQLGLKQHDLEQYQKFVGNGMKKLVERALPENYDNFEEALALFLEDYSHHYADDSKPYNNVRETLLELNRRGIPIAVATNKKQEYTDGIMKAFLSDINFVGIIGDQFDGMHKPNPHYPLELAKKMGCDPSTVYFVGDSDVDMKTAHNANMIAVGVSWGFRSVEELKEHGAAMIIDDMSEILELL